MRDSFGRISYRGGRTGSTEAGTVSCDNKSNAEVMRTECSAMELAMTAAVASAARGGIREQLWRRTRRPQPTRLREGRRRAERGGNGIVLPWVVATHTLEATDIVPRV